MGKESGRILECTDLQWSSRSEHARKVTYASTRVHSNASESPHSETMARRNASRSQDRWTKYTAQPDTQRTIAASRARPRVVIRMRATARGGLYKPSAEITRHTTALRSASTRLQVASTASTEEMAAQQIVDREMNVTRLEKEVSNGNYIFTRPLTIVQCAVQEKYIVYPSCQQCNKRVIPENNGYVCPIHRWQRGPVYKFCLRILLQDAIGSECWATLFTEKAVQVLGFTGNAYMSMKSDAERYAALDMLRGARVMVTIRKRVAGQYINYTVSDLEVVTV